MTITFAKRSVSRHRLYGMVILAPMFFLERLIGGYDPPSITHAEFNYGFVCTAFAWQIVYLMNLRLAQGRHDNVIPREKDKRRHTWL
jgi:hypothetical protein